MTNDTYDIITVGGDLGGSALAKAMAEHGARVRMLLNVKGCVQATRGELAR